MSQRSVLYCVKYIYNISTIYSLNRLVQKRGDIFLPEPLCGGEDEEVVPDGLGVQVVQHHVARLLQQHGVRLVAQVAVEDHLSLDS